MKEKSNKELIECMVDTLRDHSVPYKEGAWERFAASQVSKRKISPLWYLTGAAAMLLLGVAIFMNSGVFDADKTVQLSKYAQIQTDARDSDIAGQEQQDQRERFNNQKETDELVAKSPVLAFTPSGGEYAKSQPNQVALDEKPIPTLKADLSSLSVSGEAELENLGASVGAKDEKLKVRQLIENRKEISKEEALIHMLSEGKDYASSEKSSVIQKNKKSDTRKWNLGLMFSPSLTDERVNIGGGVTVAYRISKKVSVGSGISLVDLGFRQNSPNSQGGGMVMDSPAPASLNKESPMFNARSQETKQLTSINTNLLALDIPIDIKYQVSSYFYASAGVSFFAVLNEDRTNNFLTQAPTDKTMQSAEGFAFSQPEFQLRSVSEESSETPYQGNGYSGFLNFSVGRRMPVSNKIGIAVEPFIKIPVGSLSNQGMNLRYGGVRVITSF